MLRSNIGEGRFEFNNLLNSIPSAYERLLDAAHLFYGTSHYFTWIIAAAYLNKIYEDREKVCIFIGRFNFH